MSDWYTKQESETDADFGSIPEKRSIPDLLEKGFFIVDKPFGPTSKQVSNWVKEELDLRKAGHFGTLDPNATGILPVGINRGTRVSKALSEARKEYIFEAELEDQKDLEDIKKAVKGFEGVNTQIPPERSAVKREEREREVYGTETIEIEDNRLLGRVTCESGFYVRVMIRQMGEKLGTPAEMVELRRTRQGELTEDEADTLQDIVDAHKFYIENGEEEQLREVLHPVEKAVSHVKKVVIKDSAVNAVANGADLGTGGISKLQGDIKEGERIAIMTLKGELVALATAEMSSEAMYDLEGTAANLESVHMDPETYPKRWKQD